MYLHTACSKRWSEPPEKSVFIRGLSGTVQKLFFFIYFYTHIALKRVFPIMKEPLSTILYFKRSSHFHREVNVFLTSKLGPFLHGRETSFDHGTERLPQVLLCCFLGRGGGMGLPTPRPSRDSVQERQRVRWGPQPPREQVARF